MIPPANYVFAALRQPAIFARIAHLPSRFGTSLSLGHVTPPLLGLVHTIPWTHGRIRQSTPFTSTLPERVAEGLYMCSGMSRRSATAVFSTERV